MGLLNNLFQTKEEPPEGSEERPFRSHLLTIGLALVLSVGSVAGYLMYTNKSFNPMTLWKDYQTIRSVENPTGDKNSDAKDVFRRYDEKKIESDTRHYDIEMTISSPADLDKLRTFILGRKIIRCTLESDLDLEGRTLRALGDVEHPFLGSFDGNNHRIENFRMDNPNEDYVSLFPSIGRKSTFSNLVISNPVISGKMFTAVLTSYNSGNIDNVQIYNYVLNGGDLSGGLASWNYGVIENSSAILNPNYVSRVGAQFGGIVSTTNGLVKKCTAVTKAKGSIGMGGIAAQVQGFGLVDGCNSQVNLNGTCDLGGIVGSISSDCGIRSCNSEGFINSDSEGIVQTIGGIAGSASRFTSLKHNHSECQLSYKGKPLEYQDVGRVGPGLIDNKGDRVETEHTYDEVKRSLEK
ncbi:MAG: hypothetical protein PHF67_00885 [Candidatus Nanoarchaeia archaeon]|nr:hypothetical protein [Candidatus Nanoarchaeia archaeon]